MMASKAETKRTRGGAMQQPIEAAGWEPDESGVGALGLLEADEQPMTAGSPWWLDGASVPLMDDGKKFGGDEDDSDDEDEDDLGESGLGDDEEGEFDEDDEFDDDDDEFFDDDEEDDDVDADVDEDEEDDF